MNTLLKQALTNIICNWEFQNESCEKLFPTTAEYAIAYSKLTGLREALDQLKFAGLVSYYNGEWKVEENDLK